MREALEGRPERQRTRREYERVLDAYRAVYHSNPAAPRADASISAVADLLAEEGRVFQDDKALHDAIGQYEFLRANYPQSRFCYSALLTMGEIYLRDLNDPDSARSTFEQFLKAYPRNSLAPEARIELLNLRRAPRAPHRKTAVAEEEPPEIAAAIPDSRAHEGTHSDHRRQLKATAERSRRAGASVKAARRESADESTGKATARTAAGAALASQPAHLSEAESNAPPPPRKGRLPLVTGIRHWSTPVYTRVAIDLQDEVAYEAVRVPSPDRIFFDLHGARLSPELIGKSDQVIDDGFLRQIRAAQFSNDVTRIVLDVSDVSDYSAFFLPNPPRLIIDVHGSRAAARSALSGIKPEPKAARRERWAAAAAAPSHAVQEIGLGPALVAVNKLGEPQPLPDRDARAASGESAKRGRGLEDLGSLSSVPNRVRATPRPTMAPVAQSVAGTSPAPQPNEIAVAGARAGKQQLGGPGKDWHGKEWRGRARRGETAAQAPTSQLSASGEPTLVRTLGLKINRIVVDAGHGGHDSGTLGPGGIEEKDVVLDVALRLGALLKRRLGADVIYTRDDDTFIPLETRTAIANKAQADLFISIHANSSADPSARGVETYYLNFTTSADALEVAARENSVSDQSIHQLSDLVKKIALQDKINESREFAFDVEQSLYSGLEDGNPGLKDRGVKKAPFVVLIGANMPSILAEISFLTNPDDAKELRRPQYRERIAESLYRGIARYADSLRGVRLADASARASE